MSIAGVQRVIAAPDIKDTLSMRGHAAMAKRQLCHPVVRMITFICAGSADGTSRRKTSPL